MKKALRLVFVYFAFLVAGIVLWTFLHSLFMGILAMTAGERVPVLSIRRIPDSFMFCAPSVIFLSGTFMSYYKIRRPGGIPQFLAFAVLSLVSWCFILPSFVLLGKSWYKTHEIYGNSASELSAGYFRRYGDDVYFFTREVEAAGEDGIPSVVIDTSSEDGAVFRNVRAGEKAFIYNSARPYSDVLVKQAFSSGVTFRNMLDFRALIRRTQRAMNAGFSFWLGFLSLGFVLSSVYGIAGVFRWRIMNVTAVLVVTAAILVVNSAYFLPSSVPVWRNSIATGRLFVFLSGFVEAPFLTVVNVVFGILFSVIGAAVFFTRKNEF